MTPNTLRALIVDFDGTLVDSLDQAMHSFRFAVDQLGGHHISNEEIHRHFGIAANKILELIFADDPNKAHHAFELFLEHQYNHVHLSPLHDGVSELIQQVEALKLPMGIVTGRHHRDLHIMLEHHRLQQYFRVLVSDDQVSAPKPNPEGLFKATQHLGIEPNQALYIGDSPVDIAAARRAGMLSAAVLWDAHTNSALLEAENPHYVFHHPAELIEFLKEVFS